MVGRTAAALMQIDPSFALEAVPTGWQRTGRPGPDMRRARSWLGEDLDRFEEALAGYEGPVKIQLCGPWTWSAAVEDGSGRRLVRDSSFTAELAEATGLAVAEQVAQVQRRVPAATIVVQLDEPGLPAVLAGDIPTASGLGRLAAVPRPQVVAGLAHVRRPGDAPMLLHCCGAGLFTVAREAAYDGVSWDAGTDEDAEGAAEAFESGVALVPGLVPALSPGTVETAWSLFREWWRRTGLGSDAARGLAVTPSCGLAGARGDVARAALAVTREVRARLPEWDGS